MVLQRSFVEIGYRILIGMVIAQAFEEREVESSFSGVSKDCEVCVVWHSAKNILGKRTAKRKGGSSCELAHEPTILVPRLHEQHGAAIPTCFEIHDESDIIAPGMIGDKRLGSEQATLLTIGNEHDKVITERRAGTNGAQCFEYRRYARRIIARSGTASDRIVVT